MPEHPPSAVSNNSGEPKPDWPTALVDRVVMATRRVQSITTQPALSASRGIVYGLVLAFCLTATLVLIGLAVFRLADLILPGESWAAHLCAGGLFCLLGVLLWGQRSNVRSTR